MKAMLEEYGGIIATSLSAFFLIGLLFLIVTPGNPVHEAVAKLIMSAMP